MVYLGRSKGSARRVVYLWSPRLYRNDSSPLTFSDVGIFLKVELSGNASKFKKKKEILLRTFTSTSSRAATTKNVYSA